MRTPENVYIDVYGPKPYFWHRKRCGDNDVRFIRSDLLKKQNRGQYIDGLVNKYGCMVADKVEEMLWSYVQRVPQVNDIYLLTDKDIQRIIKKISEL